MYGRPFETFVATKKIFKIFSILKILKMYSVYSKRSFVFGTYFYTEDEQKKACWKAFFFHEGY